MPILGSTTLTGLASINSNTTTPPIINNSSGTEIGTFCRAWVNFNGTLAAASMVKASYNVSSITDNGTGDYTINFTTAMADTNFCVTGSPTGNADGNLAGMVWTLNTSDTDFTKTTSSVRLKASRTTNNEIRDAYGCHVAIFR